jgi:hypothetical protein
LVQADLVVLQQLTVADKTELLVVIHHSAELVLPPSRQAAADTELATKPFLISEAMAALVAVHLVQSLRLHLVAQELLVLLDRDTPVVRTI